MNPIAEDLSAHEQQLENVWCRLHGAWVQMSDALAVAEEELQGTQPLQCEVVYVDALRVQVRMHASMLEQFEARLRDIRNRAVAYRQRYP